jgi:ABC-type phosphate/phosphonate transport system substrate-binding protein
MQAPTLVGAVLYDPKVAIIWDIIREFFASRDCPIDCVYYTNYELMVRALVERQIEIAWNSPLAWIDAQRRTGGTCRALAMRDTDRDRVSHLLVRADSGIRDVADLKGKVVATGALDSPQATLIPLGVLRGRGLQAGRDFEQRRFDVLVGKHGDHIGGERDAVRALLAGEVDAACILDSNRLAFAREGTLPTGAARVILQTGPYDHCNFTVLDGGGAQTEAFRQLLLAMSYADPVVRPLLDLEGLTQWLPGRTTGYAALARAAERDGSMARWLAELGAPTEADRP